MQDIYFEYENKKFFINIDNKNIFCQVKNDLDNKLDNNDKNVVINVIKTLTPNVFSTYFIDKYSIFYDYNKKLYYTDLNDNNFVKYINNTYNNMSNILYFNNSLLDNNKDYIIRFIKIKNKMISVFISSTLSLTLLTGCSYLNNEDISLRSNLDVSDSIALKNMDILSKDLYSVSHYATQYYDYSIIENAINENIYLKDEEKDFLSNFKNFFDTYYTYMDLEMCIDRLSSLEIIYNPEDSENSFLGHYNVDDNKITIYNSSSINDCNIQVFIHELLHVFQKPSENHLLELSNELFSREVVRKFYEEGIIPEDRMLKGIKNDILVYGDGYSYSISLFYALAETLSMDTLIKYQFSCDTNVIVQDLITNNDGQILPKEEALNFIINCNELNYKNENDEKDKLLDECLDNLNYYYTIKNGHDIKSNLFIGINFLNRSAYNPYNEEENQLIENLMISAIDEETKMNNEIVFGRSIFSNFRYVVPRTYYSNDHKDYYVVFISPSVTKVNITEDLAEEFYNDYSLLNNEISNIM